MSRWLLLLLLVTPVGLHGQAPAVLRIEGVGQAAPAPLDHQSGYPAYPATALALLGAELHFGPASFRALLLGDTLHFEILSPFFLAGGRVSQLVAPVYREAGIVYLPHQFFTEWLPAHYAGRITYQAGVLRLRPPTLAQRAEPAATRPPADSVAAPAGRGPAEAARVVVLDAGHGGRDPGRIGPNGVREKDVALAVALRLAALLRSRGYEVHVTRSSDTLIDLADRTRLANEWKAGRPAALFLSLHANAGPSGAEGFESFFLSAARTEDERRVADMENAAVAFEDAPAAQPVPELDHILSNLRNNFYLHASNNLAETVQRRLASFHPGPNRGVKQAGFRVLIGALMPAALVELAFISNPREARLLGTSPFQQKLAWALADAVDRFFSMHQHLLVAGEAG
ncbi:MAG: N-acetylmuramoyl-L-alanine amidase [Gemmatimonadetes bacterium]|nr:N-acetylmuramoyl-L-alanine amidase [Gemmatimonadota bacterium]